MAIEFIILSIGSITIQISGRVLFYFHVNLKDGIVLIILNN